jgi:hypothetical protein
VDQHDVGLVDGERLKPGMHLGLARCAAIGGRGMAQAGDGVVEEGDVVGIYNRLNRGDVGMAAERLHGAKDHGLPADGAILLRPAGARAEAAPGCDKDGGGTHRLLHWIQNLGDVG